MEDDLGPSSGALYAFSMDGVGCQGTLTADSWTFSLSAQTLVTLTYQPGFSVNTVLGVGTAGAISPGFNLKGQHIAIGSLMDPYYKISPSLLVFSEDPLMPGVWEFAFDAAINSKVATLIARHEDLSDPFDASYAVLHHVAAAFSGGLVHVSKPRPLYLVL